MATSFRSNGHADKLPDGAFNPYLAASWKMDLINNEAGIFFDERKIPAFFVIKSIHLCGKLASSGK
jgi:hypothetical protein